MWIFLDIHKALWVVVCGLWGVGCGVWGVGNKCCPLLMRDMYLLKRRKILPTVNTRHVPTSKWNILTLHPIPYSLFPTPPLLPCSLLNLLNRKNSLKLQPNRLVQLRATLLPIYQCHHLVYAVTRLPQALNRF